MFRSPVRVARCAVLACGVAACLSFAATTQAAFTTFSVGGDTTPASIQATVDAFRAALGNPNNGNTPGPLATGRREINWDGGGATTATATLGPLLAFQNTRGAIFTTPGTGFLQTPVNAVELTGLNPTYATEFAAFSPQRIFVPVASNITDVTFALPGSGGQTPATVAGFGAIFTDVDLANSTKLEFFGLGGNLLETILAPAGTVTSASQSFAGGIASAGERIARVRITSGNSPLVPTDNPQNQIDVVAMDDFFYNEPVAVPEPTTATAIFVIATLCAASIRPKRPAPTLAV